MAELKTPLTDWHVAHGAKMAPFAGWLMPIQYEGILVEHQHTRQHAGLFDICHTMCCRWQTRARWSPWCLLNRPMPRWPPP